MKYSEWKTDEDYPEKGYLLAYTRERILFQRYCNAEQIRDILEDADILELHLFDKDKEYRLLVSESKRYEDKGFVETLVTSEMINRNDTESVYRQETKLEEKFNDGTELNENTKGKLYVLNHVTYDKSGMAVIDNYRMYVEEGENA